MSMTPVHSPVRSPLDRARAVAASVIDPEMPMLTLADLGVLRDVAPGADGSIVVTITPTYSGCPAMAAIRDDLCRALHGAGFADVDVRLQLAPAWSTDWISADARRKLESHGIAAPLSAAASPTGPIPLTLTAQPAMVCCPRCDSFDTEQISRFSSTACKSLHRCKTCGEPFERIKEI